MALPSLTQATGGGAAITPSAIQTDPTTARFQVLALQVRLVLGQLVEPVLRDDHGALSAKVITDATNITELRSFLVNRLGVDNLSFRSPYANIIQDPRLTPLLELLLWETGLRTLPFNYQSCETALHQLEADLIGADADSFVTHHLRTQDGRERLKRILGDQNFYNQYYTGSHGSFASFVSQHLQGYSKQSWKADLTKAFARAGKGVVDNNASSALTNHLSLWNFTNLGITEAEITNAYRKAEAILTKSGDTYKKQDKKLADYQDPAFTSSLAKRNKIDEMISAYQFHNHQGRTAHELHAKLARVWLMVADDSCWQDMTTIYTNTPALRQGLLDRIETIINQIPQKSRSEEGLKELNAQIQKLVHGAFFGTEAEHRASDRSLKKFLGMMNGAYREPFDQLVKCSDELYYSWEMGEIFTLVPYQSSSAQASQDETQNLKSQVVSGLDQARRALWYGYKQHRAISRGLSQVANVAGYTGDIAQIRKANALMARWIQQISWASDSDLPQVLEEIHSEMYASLKAGGELDLAFKAAEMEGSEALLGLAQTMAIIAGSRYLGTRIPGVKTMLTRATTLPTGVKGFGLGFYIAEAENVAAVVSGEVRQTGEENLASLAFDGLATGAAMAFLGVFKPLGEASESLAKRMLTRLVKGPWVKARAFQMLGTLAKGLLRDGAIETVEETLDQIVRKFLQQGQYYGMDGFFDFDAIALSKRELTDLAAVSFAGGGLKANMIIELLGNRGRPVIPTGEDSRTERPYEWSRKGKAAEIVDFPGGDETHPSLINKTGNTQRIAENNFNNLPNVTELTEEEALAGINVEAVERAIEGHNTDGRERVVKEGLVEAGREELLIEEGEDVVWETDDEGNLLPYSITTRDGVYQRGMVFHTHDATNQSPEEMARVGVIGANDWQGFLQDVADHANQVRFQVVSPNLSNGINGRQVFTRVALVYHQDQTGTQGYFEIVGIGVAGLQAGFHPELRRRLQEELREGLRLFNTRTAEENRVARAATPSDAGKDGQGAPLSEREVADLILYAAQAPTDAAYRGRLADLRRSGRFTDEAWNIFAGRTKSYRDALTAKGLENYVGFAGIDADGKIVHPKHFRFSGIELKKGPATGETIYISDRFKDLAVRITGDKDFRRYFAGADSTLAVILALASVVVDHNAEALEIATEDERCLFAWELLARLDSELEGKDYKELFHSVHHQRKFEALQGFIATSGLKPMSQRALAIRDGRERPIGIFSGQGSNYIKELKELIEAEPSARALYNELKPLFAQYNIDLDDMLTLADADQAQIENYYRINDTTVAMPMIALAQMLWVRTLEDYGYNVLNFHEIIGQSGGLPAAMFTAYSFEDEGYQPSVVPKGLGGTRTVESFRRYAEWMLVEGRFQQVHNPVHYDPSVKKMVSLRSWLGEERTAEKIDDYFRTYQVNNVVITGIPYEAADHDTSNQYLTIGKPKSSLGKIIRAINRKYEKQGSYVYVSNVNTGETPTGTDSHMILVAGKGPAMAELAKLIVTGEAEGYRLELQTLVRSWQGNLQVRVPTTNARITLAPHDPRDLINSHEGLITFVRQKGWQLRRPLVPVRHNWTAQNIQDHNGDYNELIIGQQFDQAQVHLPRMVNAAVLAETPEGKRGTSIIGLGTGDYLEKTNIPAIIGRAPIDVTGVATKKDAEGMSGLTRLTTRHPEKAYQRRNGFNHEAQESTLGELREMGGLTVTETEEDGDGEKIISVRVDKAIAEGDFPRFRDALLGIDAASPFAQLIESATIQVGNKQEPNPLKALVRANANIEYRFQVNEYGMQGVTIVERGIERIRMEYGDNGEIKLTEYTYPVSSPLPISLVRIYANHDGSFEQTHISDFRHGTRVAYAQDWNLDIRGITKEQTFTDTQRVTTDRMVAFGRQMQSREARYVDTARSDFQPHPHFLIDLMWGAMIRPAFVDEFDMDFTRVIDEEKSIRFGVPVKAGDTITTEARIARAEDFKAGTYEGRRVLVHAIARNQHGEIVGEVTSTLVSRIPTRVEAGETKVIYKNDSVTANIDFMAGLTTSKTTDERGKPLHTIAKGSLRLPLTLADTYTLDPNRIHVSDLSAALAGFPNGRIMQGMATLAYVNEQVMTQLKRDGIVRTHRGVSNLRFSGIVKPGTELTYEVGRKVHGEGEHLFEVKVKDGNRTIMTYDIAAQGLKTAVVVTGQGSQYEGMDQHVIADPENAELIDIFQGWIPKKSDVSDEPLVDLKAEMAKGTKDTSKAQPMIIAYELVIAANMIFNGDIPRDASYSGHSLGMWGAIIIALMQSEWRRLAREGKTFTTKAEFIREIAPFLKPIMVGVAMRGAKMGGAANEGMIGVIASSQGPELDLKKLEILFRTLTKGGDSLEVANYNSHQVVILGGTKTAIEQATPVLKAWGYRISPTGVEDAFHTKRKQPSSDEFGRWVAQEGNPFTILPEQLLYMDIEGRPLHEIIAEHPDVPPLEILVDIMTRQIASPVNWQGTVEAMLKDGHRVFYELGGKADLKGHIERIAANLGIKDEVEVIWPNPFKSEKDWDRIRFRAEPKKVSEYDKPRLVYPTAKKVAEEVTDAEVAVAEAPPRVQIIPAGQFDAPPPVSRGQLTALTEGFFVGLDGDLSSRVDALAEGLAAQIVTLGAGARGVITQALADLRRAQSSATTTAAPTSSTATSIVDRVIAVLKKDTGNSAITPTSKLVDDLGLGSIELEGSLAVLDKELGVSVESSEFATVEVLTVSVVADKYKAAGAKDATGETQAPAAPVVLDARQQIVLKALEMAQTRLPADAPVQRVVAAEPVETVRVLPDSQVSGVIDRFFTENPADGGDTNTLAGKLASQLQALGLGALIPLTRRLDQLRQARPAPSTTTSTVTSASTSSSAASTAASIVDRVIAVLKKDTGNTAITPTSKLVEDLGLGSIELEGSLAVLDKELGVSVESSEFATVEVLTVAVVADKYKAAGAKDTTGETQAPASPASTVQLSARDTIELRGIEQAIGHLENLTPPSNSLPQGEGGPRAIATLSGTDRAKIDALESTIAELEARLARLESGPLSPGGRATEGSPSGRLGRGGDVRIEVGKDGKLHDSERMELEALREILANIRAAMESKVGFTDSVFVDMLTQPHFRGVKRKGESVADYEARVANKPWISDAIYEFDNVAQNGGRLNLIEFVADVRANRLPLTAHDRNAKIVGLANQLDEIGLRWLAGFIVNEERGGHTENAATLRSVFEIARVNLENNKITTAGVVTIRGVNFVPEYGSDNKVKVVVRTEGTEAIWEEMKPLADPKSVPEVEKLIKEGYDLHGLKVLVQQAGTLSSPLIAKALAQGAHVYVTDFVGRSDNQPNGEVSNDYYWSLYNRHAARGAKLTLIPRMQPGNSHDQFDLEEFLEFPLKADVERKKQEITALKAEGKSTSKLEAQLVELEKANKPIIPDIYLSGASFPDYPKTGKVTEKGDPHTVLAIMSFSPRDTALAIAALHKKHNTGRRVVFFNYYSPNSLIDLAAKEEEIQGAIRARAIPEVKRLLGEAIAAKKAEALPPEGATDTADTSYAATITALEELATTVVGQLEEGLAIDPPKNLFSLLAGSGTYPRAKAILRPGMVAAEAFAGGLLDAKGNPLLVEVSGETGWGKSNGDAKTIMSGHDFYTMRVEEMAHEQGFTLLSLTGDQLATVHLSAALAAHSGFRDNTQAHHPRDYSYGFKEAAKRGVLAKIMVEAATEENKKHSEARKGWKEAHSKKEDPRRIENDGSIVDPNNLPIAIVGPTEGPHGVKRSDMLFGDKAVAVSAYGAVGPLAPDARGLYFGMLGEFDFYNLARAMGIDVSKWDYEEMLASVDIDPTKVRDAKVAFEAFLLKNSGIQQINDNLAFTLWQDATFQEDTQIPLSNDPNEVRKYQDQGYEIYRQPDGTAQYALARAGSSHKVPITVRIPVTIGGFLPGHNIAVKEVTRDAEGKIKVGEVRSPKGFAFDVFGITDKIDVQTEAHAAHIAKIAVGQMMMALGGMTPGDIEEHFGPSQTAVGWAEGLADTVPNLKINLKPILQGGAMPEYHRMAGQLPDGPAGQIATEMFNAERMALSNIAACTTANSNGVIGSNDIIAATMAHFQRYYLASKRLAVLKEEGRLMEEILKIADPEERKQAYAMAHVEWDQVFARIWFYGGSDFATSYNTFFGFIPTTALVMDDWRKARDLVLKQSSRPDDEERAGFVVAIGGGGQAVEPLPSVIKRGGPVYGMQIGRSFRTDGNKIGRQREGYGIGQVKALFEAWDQARGHLTEARFTSDEVKGKMANMLGTALGRAVSLDNGAQSLADLRLTRSQRTAFVAAFQGTFDFQLMWDDVKELGRDHFEGGAWSREKARELAKPTWEKISAIPLDALYEHVVDRTRTLRPKVKIVVQAHKTSTGEGDKYENNSLHIFLSEILPEGDLAYLFASKAHFGHALGGSSGIDAAVSPFIGRYQKVPGAPGLDNVMEGAAANDKLLHHKHPVNLKELYDDDTTIVVVRESSGFNAKNSCVIEAFGKVAFATEEEATDYAANLLQTYARERTQRRAEREGKRYMTYNMHRVQDVPVAEYTDLYELSIRSQAIARALMAGETFDFDNILTWIYRFPVNDINALTVNPAATPEQQLTQYNAIKYAQAQAELEGILRKLHAKYTPEQLAELGRLAREQGLHEQPWELIGHSDGINLRMLVTLIEAGAIDEVAGHHRDDFIDNPDPKKRATKSSAFMPGVLAAYAASKGVHIVAQNTFDPTRKTFPNGAVLFDGETGAPIPMPKPMVDTVEAVRANKPGKGEVLVDAIAFGATRRRVGAGNIKVPTIDEFGRGKLDTVLAAKDEEFARLYTLNTMGHSHGRQMEVREEMGWLTDDSHTFTFDWWGGEEGSGMLEGVYGGAVLGDAKMIAKAGIIDFEKKKLLGKWFGSHLTHLAPTPLALEKLLLESNQTLAELGLTEEAAGEVVEMLNRTYGLDMTADRLLGQTPRELVDNVRQRIRVASLVLLVAPASSNESYQKNPFNIPDNTVFHDVVDEAKRDQFVAALNAKYSKNFTWNQLAQLPVQGLSGRILYSGRHLVIGFPAMMTFALNAIPGGTLTGLIAKRIYEDIQGGMTIAGVGQVPAGWKIKFHDMEELAFEAIGKFLRGEFTGKDGNVIAVDMHEKAVAPEINRRFHVAQERIERALREKGVDILSREEIHELLQDLFPPDYLDYHYQHIADLEIKRRLTRELAQERAGQIEGIELPQRLKSDHPFLQRAYSSSVNTPELAIAVIDAGGIGSLASGELSTEDLATRIIKVHEQVGDDAPLVVNVSVANSTKKASSNAPSLLDNQLAVIIQQKPAAVSFKDGFVTVEQAKALKAAGIQVLQIVDSKKDAAIILDLVSQGAPIDGVIVERNLTPGFYNPLEDSGDIVKSIRQSLYEGHIPVIASGGYVTPEDVETAKQWGASAVELDDAIVHAKEGDQARSQAWWHSVNPTDPVIELVGYSGRAIRLMKTPAAEALIKGALDVVGSFVSGGYGIDEAAPVVAMMISEALARGEVFEAGANIAHAPHGQRLPNIFTHLNIFSNPVPSNIP